MHTCTTYFCSKDRYQKQKNKWSIKQNEIFTINPSTLTLRQGDY